MHTPKKDPYTEGSAPRSQIEELYDHIRPFRRFPKGYRALHMHFSVLDRLHQQPHHRRAIATTFNKLIAPYEGKLFWMHNFDLFFVCKNCPQTKLESVQFDALRAVDDSPVLKQLIENSQDDEVCTWYDLTTGYEEFYSLVEKLRRNINSGITENTNESPNLKSLMAELDPESIESALAATPEKKIVIEKKATPQYEHAFSEPARPPIGPMELDKLERNLGNMDIFALINKQNICVVMDDMPPQIVFTKKYISLKEINESILPGYNISGDKWLFQRLTETFDRKLMKSLVAYKNFPQNVLSVNMNISTIASKEFDKFIEQQKSLSVHPLILEITLFDIMSDLTAYFKAQEKIERYGCKICICKMDIQSLYVLDRELINVDFLKIQWKKEYIGSISQTAKEKIARAVKSQGKMRVVLSDCDSQEAIRFGKDLGIVMYQGFEIDKLQRIL